MTPKNTNEPTAFSQQAQPENACGEQYTPLGVRAALARLGESPNSDAGDPCCGSGLIVSAEMLNRAHTAGA